MNYLPLYNLRYESSQAVKIIFLILFRLPLEGTEVAHRLVSRFTLGIELRQ